VAGFVATEAGSGSAVAFLSLLVILLFVSERSYFAVFGTRIDLFGLTLLPFHIFFVPSVVLIVLVALAVVSSKRTQ